MADDRYHNNGAMKILIKTEDAFNSLWEMMELVRTKAGYQYPGYKKDAAKLLKRRSTSMFLILLLKEVSCCDKEGG